MNKFNPQSIAARRSAGRLSPVALAVLVLLSICIGAVAYLAIQGDKAPGENTTKRTTQSAQQIADELAALQQEFQTVLQEKLDLPRFEARARDFAKRNPGETDGHVLLAQVRMQMQRWEEAYASWLRALEDMPEGFELNKMAGFCAVKLDRLAVAEQHYRDAVRVSGDAADCDVYAALGRLMIARGDTDAAELSFKRALDAPAPGEKTNWKHAAYAGLADVASLRGDLETAIQHIDLAINLANADSQADRAGYFIQKARIYRDAGQPEQAVAMLIFAWDQEPDAQWRIESARLRAALHEQAGELEKAVRHVAFVCDYHQRDPDRRDRIVAEYVALLAEWQIKAGLKNQAMISLDNLATLAPEHARLPELRAKLQ